MPAPRKLNGDFLNYLRTTLSDSQVVLRSNFADSTAFRQAVETAEQGILQAYPFASQNSAELTDTQAKLLDRRIRDECKVWFGDRLQFLTVCRAYNQRQYRIREDQITGAGKAHRAEVKTRPEAKKPGHRLKAGQIAVGVSEGTAAMLDVILKQEDMEDRDEVINWLCRSYFADVRVDDES